MNGGGGLAIVVKGGGKEPRYGASSEGDEAMENDEFDMGFQAFRKALDSGDAAKAKKAFMLMKASCEEGYDDEDEEG